MKHWSLLFVLFALFVVDQSANGQRRARRPEYSFYYEFGQEEYMEVINRPADDRAKSRVQIDIRVSYDALTFQKPPEVSSTGMFTAQLGVRVELLDNRDVTVQRASWHDTVRVASYLETNDKYKYVVATLGFDVDPGTYTLIVGIDDQTARKAIREYRPHVVLRDFRKPVALSTPLLLAHADSGAAHPINIGGNAEFGTPFTAYVDAVCDSGVPTVRYSLSRKNKGDSIFVYAHGEAVVSQNAVLGVAGHRCCALAPAVSGKYGCRIDVRGDSLDIGDYVLHLEAFHGRDTVHDSSSFRVSWPTMPLSLTETDYSIDAMRYILSDGELDSMRSGNAAERKKQFDAYWALHDPTPGTIYNERKAEYFRRVDYAYFTFRNSSKEDDDGMRTDRGKIHILYGKPTSIDRQLIPDGPAQEIWTYANNVRKRFTFVDLEKSGGYRLTEVKDLQ